MRIAAWLTIIFGWSLCFWLVVWPDLLAYCLALGGVLAVAVMTYEAIPRARVVDAAERTWRRYQ